MYGGHSVIAGLIAALGSPRNSEVLSHSSYFCSHSYQQKHRITLRTVSTIENSTR